MQQPLLDTLGRRNRKHSDKACENCSAMFKPKRADSKYCSRRCMWDNNGKHNQRPDGSDTWWLNNRGYIEGRVWIDGRPRRVKQHRWIMEQHLGRPLDPNENVHHIDGNKTNNHIENLQLLNHSEHSRVTNEEREYARGYKLQLTDAERQRRTEHMREMRTSSET